MGNDTSFCSLDNSCVNPPHVANVIRVTRPIAKYPSGDRLLYECNKLFDLFGEVEVMGKMGFRQNN